MMIHTIEMNFDHQIALAMKATLKDLELEANDMTGPEMMDAIWANPQMFGNRVLEIVNEFMHDDEWYEKVAS